MTRRFDVAVLGLGAMGSAILYQLAKRGAAAVGLVAVPVALLLLP